MTVFSRRFARATGLAVQHALEESALRGDPRIGTEHLLLGLLRDPRAGPATALGVDLDRVREAVHALDVEALQAVGVDTGEFRPLATVRDRRRRPFTSGAKFALGRTAGEVARSKDRRIDPNHLLAGLLAGRRPDPALAVLDRLGIDPEAVRARLAAGGLAA